MAFIDKLILLVHLLQSTLGVEEQGLQLLDTSNRCLCPGDSLTYECTVLGEPHGSTVWNGSGFNCTSQEIVLFHGSTEGIHGKCGDIVGQSLRSDVDVNATNSNSTTVSHYTSRLTVPINSGTVGRTIECHYDDGQTSTLVGREKVNITIDPSPPETLYISNADFISRKLIFSWSTDYGTKLHYNILASNCGSCPTTTNHTNATCTNAETNGSLCTFAVQTVACGNITGQLSNTIEVSILNPTVTDNVIVLLDMNNPDTSIVCIISISVLAAALIVSVVVSITVIIIIARRKAKTNGSLDLQLANQTEKDRDTDSTYDDVTGALPSVSAISTQDNIAYHHTHKQQH